MTERIPVRIFERASGGLVDSFVADKARLEELERDVEADGNFLERGTPLEKTMDLHRETAAPALTPLQSGALTGLDDLSFGVVPRALAAAQSVTTGTPFADRERDIQRAITEARDKHPGAAAAGTAAAIAGPLLLSGGLSAFGVPMTLGRAAAQTAAATATRAPRVAAAARPVARFLSPRSGALMLGRAGQAMGMRAGSRGVRNLARLGGYAPVIPEGVAAGLGAGAAAGLGATDWADATPEELASNVLGYAGLGGLGGGALGAGLTPLLAGGERLFRGGMRRLRALGDASRTATAVGGSAPMARDKILRDARMRGGGGIDQTYGDMARDAREMGLGFKPGFPRSTRAYADIATDEAEVARQLLSDIESEAVGRNAAIPMSTVRETIEAARDRSGSGALDPSQRAHFDEAIREIEAGARPAGGTGVPDIDAALRRGISEEETAALVAQQQQQRIMDAQIRLQAATEYGRALPREHAYAPTQGSVRRSEAAHADALRAAADDPRPIGDVRAAHQAEQVAPPPIQTAPPPPTRPTLSGRLFHPPRVREGDLISTEQVVNDLDLDAYLGGQRGGLLPPGPALTRDQVLAMRPSSPGEPAAAITRRVDPLGMIHPGSDPSPRLTDPAEFDRWFLGLRWRPPPQTKAGMGAADEAWTALRGQTPSSAQADAARVRQAATTTRQRELAQTEIDARLRGRRKSIIDAGEELRIAREGKFTPALPAMARVEDIIGRRAGAGRRGFTQAEGQRGLTPEMFGHQALYRPLKKLERQAHLRAGTMEGFGDRLRGTSMAQDVARRTRKVAQGAPATPAHEQGAMLDAVSRRAHMASLYRDSLAGTANLESTATAGGGRALLGGFLGLAEGGLAGGLKGYTLGFVSKRYGRPIVATSLEALAGTASGIGNFVRWFGQARGPQLWATLQADRFLTERDAADHFVESQTSPEYRMGMETVGDVLSDEQDRRIAYPEDAREDKEQ